MKTYGKPTRSGIFLIIVSLAFGNLLLFKKDFTLLEILIGNVIFSFIIWAIALQFFTQIKIYQNRIVIYNQLKFWRTSRVIRNKDIVKLLIKSEGIYGGFSLRIYVNDDGLKTSSWTKRYSYSSNMSKSELKVFVNNLAKINADLVWRHNLKLYKKKYRR